MHIKLIKTGAYITLVIGVLAALALLLTSVVVFVAYPEASLVKRAVIALAFLIGSSIISIFFTSVFESMIELTKVEREFEEIKDRIEK